MSLFQEAAQLNNRAVASLLKGDEHKTAVESIGRATKLLKARLSRHIAGVESNSSGAGTQRPCTVEISRMESSDSIVFNQAIRIPVDVEPSDFDVKVYTSAVIFNLALAHHCNASGDAMCMAKAEKLYSTVLKLLDDKALKAHTALVVKLACINNLSQIRYSKGDYKNLREGMAEVSRFMRRTSNLAFLDEPDVQCLLMNVLLLKAPVVASVA